MGSNVVILIRLAARRDIRLALLFFALESPFSFLTSTRALFESHVRNLDVIRLRQSANVLVIVGDHRNIAARLTPEEAKQNRLPDTICNVSEKSGEVELLLEKKHAEDRSDNDQRSENLRDLSIAEG